MQALKESQKIKKDTIVNDFSLVVATANGTGSQTANLTILRSFFNMGIPVHGKNIFPSNIQGLPTWYHIRVSKDGYVSRKPSELLIAFNPTTITKDINELPSGGVCIYNSDIKGLPERDDISFYPLPVKELIKDIKMPPKQKSYVANMVYVGALAWLIDIPLANLEEALSVQFGGRQKLVDINMPLIKQSYDWAKENLAKQNRFKVEKMNKTDGLIMMTGNEAAALGAIYGGVSFVSWYPITPSTGIVDNLLKYLPKLRKDKDGNPSYAVVQAEDELAAAGMIIGAGWAGARSMTATSGPGISLMAEFTGLAYVAEIPTVIWDVQRVGPSTGLPTRTAQCDVAFVYTLGHGDTNNPVLLPSSIEEAFEFGYKALDLADQLQSPVFVLSDLDLGMNNWMGHPFEYPKEDIKRGKVLDAQELTEVENYGRYKDIDGDGIPYRTIPGNSNPKSAWFARGVGHDEYAVYSEDPEVFAATMARKARKFNTARSLLPEAEVKLNKKAELGIIAYGTTRYAIEEAIDLLKAQGMELSFLRLKALPVDKKLVRDFIESHKNNYVIELNRDGQVFRILQNEFPDLTSKLASIAHIDGMPLMATWVKEQILEDQA